MTYTQLSPTGTIKHVLTDAIVEWDATHKCHPHALTDAEKALFCVWPYQHTTPPDHNPRTQGLRENLTGQAVILDGAVLQQWEVYPLPADEVEANREQAVQQARESAKSARAAAVEAITVTTAAGNTFDGDEISQGRMARAIIALQATNTPATLWVLSDNSVIEASVGELAEALALSGAAQSALWVIE